MSHGKKLYAVHKIYSGSEFVQNELITLTSNSLRMIETWLINVEKNKGKPKEIRRKGERKQIQLEENKKDQT